MIVWLVRNEEQKMTVATRLSGPSIKRRLNHPAVSVFSDNTKIRKGNNFITTVTKNSDLVIIHVTGTCG